MSIRVGSRLVDGFPGMPAKRAALVIEKCDPVTLPKPDVVFASLPTGASPERCYGGIHGDYTGTLGTLPAAGVALLPFVPLGSRRVAAKLPLPPD